ncbi:Winged helix-turn-helix transcription repressor DNA-binding protein [Arabidopsis thaliana]|nr:Winged helix-turn-helix transcription repressor DNA-binding protein [Arabidopsis thaliana]AEE35993.1 Winged helix-turn-helix transcription repressor DNA-binding protein [Arabidopsis thaliana]BAD44574.1 putative DNA-binding protein [Arabidopsis thaliana]|eukprot:NP_177880.2 Winged helix-turn-helix transcription repressor DNA-binding protein [Arabidopsis thaliana]
MLKSRNPNYSKILICEVCEVLGMGYNFYMRVYEVVDDASTDAIISWSESNNSFIIWNVGEFYRRILPKYVDLGTNLSRFFSNLRSHGFKIVKGRTGVLEFGHEDFIRDKLELMKKMVSDKRKARKAAKSKARKARVQVEFLFQHLQI